MHDQVAQLSQEDRLNAEVGRLRAEVARLEGRVAELDELAHRDSLVALPNRRGFMRRLEGVVERVKRYNDGAAMLFIDLDGLKLINDSFGHKAGDEALIHVAELLTGGVRHGDCVARIGGDEFAVLLERADERSAYETANRLDNVIAGCEFAHDGEGLPLSVAIGVAMIGADDDAESVMKRADGEMYKRKAA
jgi:diguanylate cyclase (GGDEF)-like protein